MLGVADGATSFAVIGQSTGGVDRKKDLIITSGGENISPAAIENLLAAHLLTGQALSYGDRRSWWRC